MPPADVATALRLRAEHDAVAPAVEQIRSVANGLPDATATSPRCAHC